MNGQVRVTYAKDDFNKVVELAQIALETSEGDDKKTAEKFVDKVLKYSYVKDDYVSMNLYPSETRFLINILTNYLKAIDIRKEWINDLIQNKEEYKKMKEGENNA